MRDKVRNDRKKGSDKPDDKKSNEQPKPNQNNNNNNNNNNRSNANHGPVNPPPLPEKFNAGTSNEAPTNTSSLDKRRAQYGLGGGQPGGGQPGGGQPGGGQPGGGQPGGGEGPGAGPNNPPPKRHFEDAPLPTRNRPTL